MVRLAARSLGVLAARSLGVLASFVLSSNAELMRSSLTILVNNDIESDPSPGAGAILVGDAVDHSSAEAACDAMSETLWTGKDDDSFESLKTSLAYQAHIGHYDSEAMFWVARDAEARAKGKGAECKCQAIGINGLVRSAKCSDKLPVLCSHGAPLSNATFADTSEKFQVTRNLGDGDITGYRDYATWKFLGIRFAPEPERFEYSTKMGKNSGSLSALKFGASCLQPNDPTSRDDCLFMNIWTPFLPGPETKSKEELKPVIFNIYGGGMLTNSGSNTNIDLGNFASRGDVVGVNFNYRMGNLGMLVFDDGVHNGNMAISDQLSALRWVRENIAAFGGDPDRITISGESAGAMSTRWLLASPEAEGLYAGALMQSDGLGSVNAPWGIFWTPEQSYNSITKSVLTTAGCQDAEDEVECLRQVPGDELASMAAVAKWPVVDNKYLFTRYLVVNGSEPRYAKDIPVMIGATRDEGGIVYGDPALPVDWASLSYPIWRQLMLQIEPVIGIDVERLFENLDLIGINPESTPDELYVGTAKAIGSAAFNCLDQAKAWSAAKNDVFEKVYVYNFNRTYNPRGYTNKYCDPPKTTEFPFGDPSQEYMKCHGGLQMPTFGTLKRSNYPDRDGLDYDFSRLVIDYFSSFIRTGDPNPDPEFLRARGFESTLKQIEKIGEWEVLDPSAPEEMVMQWNGLMAPFRERELCTVLGQPLDFWETL